MARTKENALDIIKKRRQGIESSEKVNNAGSSDVGTTGAGRTKGNALDIVKERTQRVTTGGASARGEVFEPVRESDKEPVKPLLDVMRGAFKGSDQGQRALPMSDTTRQELELELISGANRPKTDNDRVRDIEIRRELEYDQAVKKNNQLPAYGSYDYLVTREKELASEMQKIESDPHWKDDVYRNWVHLLKTQGRNAPENIRDNELVRDLYLKFEKYNDIYNEYVSVSRQLDKYDTKGVHMDPYGEVDADSGRDEAIAVGRRKELLANASPMTRDEEDAAVAKDYGYNIDVSPITIARRNEYLDYIHGAWNEGSKADAYQYYKENKDNMYDDSLTGRFSGNYKLGRIGIKSNEAGYTTLLSGTKDIEASEVYQLLSENIVKNNIKTFTNKNGYEETLATVAQYAPQGLDQLAYRTVGQIFGGLSRLGGNFLGSVATARYAYTQTAGAAFVSLVQENPELEVDEIRKMAENEALASAVVEFGLDWTVGNVWYGSGGKKLAESAEDKILKLLLKTGMSEKSAKAIMKVSKTAGGVALKSTGEGVEEWIQEGISITSKRYADKGDSLSAFDLFLNSFDFSQYSDEDFKRMNESFKGGFIIGIAQGGIEQVKASGMQTIVSNVSGRKKGKNGSDINRLIDSTDHESIGKEAIEKWDTGLIQDALEYGKNSQSPEVIDAAKRVENAMGEGENPDAQDLGIVVSYVASRTVLEQDQDGVEHKTANPIDSVASAVNQSREGARLAVTLGENGAKAFRTVYTPEIARTVPSDVAMDGFRAIYNSAVTGKDMTEVQKAAAMKIPKIMQDIAFDSGKLDAQRAAQATYFGRDSGLIRDDSFKKANLKSRDIRILDSIAKVTGTQIRFVDTINEGSANASYGKGVISISLDSDDPVRVAMMHEVVHRLREVSPESYSFLAKFVTENMSEESYSFAFAAVKSQYSGENTDTISEEVIAHALGTIMGDSKKLDSLIKSDRTTWEKLCDALHDIIVSIKRVLRKGSGARLSEEQRRVFSELLDKYEGMESVLKEALDRTAAKTQQAQKNTAEAVKVKFSNKQIETLTENDVRNLLESSVYGEFDDGSYIPLRRNTPAILIKEVKEHTNGSFEIKDFPIVMKVEKVRQALEEEVLGEETRQHGISVDGMIEIIKGMDDPAYIILQENGRYVEVIRYYDGKKHAAWAVLDFGISKAEAYMNGYPGGKYNILVTAFDPDDLKSYMETNVEEIIYEKKTKGSLQSGSGSLFPSHLNSSPFYISIPETSEKSNSKFSLKTSTENPDIRFSLKKPVEETKDLVAVHNISEQQLLDVLTRGEFIMPSVAVTNKGLTLFGEISVLFYKRTIDPTHNPNNRLYGSDAWTPTQTELKKNPKFDAKATANILRSIRKALGDTQIFKDNSELFKQKISKADGSVYNAYAHNVGMQAAYAMENGMISEIPKDSNGNIDTQKLQSRLDAVLDKDAEWRKYKRWLSNISNKIITSYDKASNEEILRDMKSQPDYAKKFRLSVDGELTAPVVEYSSIEDFRSNKARLSETAEQDASALGQAFLRWATDISAVSGADANKIVSVINSAFDSRYSSENLVKAFADNGITISKKRADILQSLYKEAVELSTPYFEAKPQRGVGVEEIAAVVIPDDAGAELLSKLEENGIIVVPYQSGNNTDRIEKMNSVDGVNFSKKWMDGSGFDYNSLITKPDMLITEIDDSITYTVSSATRKQIVQDALNNAKRVGKTNDRGEVFVYVDDIGENVMISANALRHGLDRRLKQNAAVTLKAGEILKNAVVINELVPKNQNAEKSYVLLGAAGSFSTGRTYIVEMVVNRFDNTMLSIDVLYSLNSKKEESAVLNAPSPTENPLTVTDSKESAVLNAPAITEKPLRITDSKISIADLIELSRRHFPDILPESALRHFGYTSRPEGELGKSALYSRKWNDDVVREVRQLKSENRELTRKIEYLRGQFKRTPEGKIDTVAIRKLARELVSTYSANVSTDSIMTKIEELYDYISVDGLKKSFSLDEMWERATKIARDIAENSIERNDSMYREYADLRKYVRTVGLSLSETDRADIPDFNDFRRRYFGKIGIRSGKTNVDSVYQEMSSLWPEFFDEEKISHPADQLMHIAEVVDDLYSIDEHNPFSADMDSAVEMIANDIIARFTDMPYAKKTFADRAADKVYLEKVRGDARVKKALERISKYQKESETRVSKIRERYREKTKEGQKKQRERELRGKIMRATHRMDMTLRRPSDKKRIPQELQVPVANLLKAINLEGMYTYDENGKRVRATDGTPTQRTLAFRELRDIYKKISGAEDMIVVSPELLEGDASTGGEILEQVVQLHDVPLHSMNEEQLSTVWKAIRMIEASVRTANKMFSDKHFKTISDAAEAIRDSARGKNSRLDIKGVSKVRDLVALDSLTPEAFFHRLGSGGEAIFRMLRDAQDKHTLIIDEIREFASGLVDDVQIHKLETTTHKVILGGEEVTLSTAQLMELYALSRREQAEKHILEGGISPERIPGVARVIRNTSIKHISPEELGNAFESLTDEEKKMALKLSDFASKNLGSKMNDSCLKVFGYEKFGERHYWPIRTDPTALKSDAKEVTKATPSISHYGMAKATTPGANTPLLIGSIFDTFSSHSAQAATYAAYLEVMEDCRRIFNFSFKDADGNETGTIKGILNSVFGSGGTRYWENLIEDISIGIKGEDSGLFDGILRQTKAASVSMNIRVMAQQPTAILRAGDLIDYHYILGGMAHSKRGWSRAKKYAPIAKWKSYGFFDANTGPKIKSLIYDQSGKLEKLREIGMAGAGMMDSFGWGTLWSACELELRGKISRAKNGADNAYTGIEPDTEEFYRAVAERFTEIIDHSQVVDGVLQRSQIMRSSNALTKMATSYMSEPTKVVNMFSDAVYDTTHAKTKAERKAAGKRLVRTSFSLLVSFAVNAALGQALIDALRDDDKEKEYWEKWMDAFTSNFADSLNPLTYFPYIKDAFSIYEGYSVGRMDLGGIENLIESTRNVIKAFYGDSKYTVEGTINNACAVIGSLFGLGTANVKRDVRAAAMLFATGTDNYVMEYRMEKGLLELTYEKNGNVFYDILFKAYSNDKKAFEIIYNDMIVGGFDGEKIKKALEKRMKKAQGVEEVTDLDERFLSPKQKKEYNSGMTEVRKSPIWKRASEKHRKNLENDVYNIVVGNSDGQKLRTKMNEAKEYGIDSTEFLLYQLALDVVDKPNEKGKYGTITNKERKKAFELVGFSKKEKAYFEGN